MRINKFDSDELIKLTFSKLIDSKRERGTILYYIKLNDKNDRDIFFLRELILDNLEKNLECIDFLFLNLNKSYSGTMFDLIIGIETITGLTKNIANSVDCSIGLLSMFDIKRKTKLEKISDSFKLEKIFSELNIQSPKKINYFSLKNFEQFGVVWNAQELLFLRNLANVSTESRLELPVLKEKSNFDELSFVNLINCYMIMNNLAVREDKLYKKIRKEGKNVWVYVDTADFFQKNIRMVFSFLKKELPGQLYDININEIVLLFSEKVFEKSCSFKDMLIVMGKDEEII